MIINPTTKEQQRFEKLQKEGMLPSGALRKLESERTTGIIETDVSKRNNNLLYIGLGAIGIVMLYIYMKSKTPTTPVMSSNKQLLELKKLNEIIRI